MPKAMSTHTVPDLPAGIIMMHAASSPPSGWLKCDGTAVSRTTYGALFGVIGTAFGSGDGSTTFNIPNFVAGSATTMRVPVGAGTGVTLGTTTGTILSNAATSQGAGIPVTFIIKF